MKSIRFFIISCIVMVGNLKHHVSANRCIHKADIGFVVDSSGSEQAYYDDVREWIKKMATAFHVDGFGNNAGVVLFSDEAEVQIFFDDHDELSEFHQAVDNLPFIGGGTRIDKGLDAAYYDLFQTQNGMRTHVHKTLVIMTDGANGGGPPLQEVIQKFHDDNIRVIVVGIGSINEQELKSMVKLEDDHLFLATDFNHLLTPEFIESTIEGCNLHTDCPAGKTELLSGTITQIQNVKKWQDCRDHCRGMQNCHYWTWYNEDANKNRRQRRPFECELKTDSHCGAFGSNCHKRHHDHAVSGSGDPNACA